LIDRYIYLFKWQENHLFQRILGYMFVLTDERTDLTFIKYSIGFFVTRAAESAFCN